MYAVSNDFTAACAGFGRGIKAKAIINGDALVNDDIISVDINESAGTSDGVTIGGTYAASLTFKLRVSPEVQPLTGATVMPYVGVAVNNTTEYVPLGKFYSAIAESNDEYKTATLKAYDMMNQLEKEYEPQITFPAQPADVVNDIAVQYGFEVEENYTYPEIELVYIECTAREMLGYIAGLMGKNALFNRDGQLRFCWYTDCDSVQITRDVQWNGATTQSAQQPITIGSIVTGTTGNVISIGSGTVIKFDNPYITSEIANDIYNSVVGQSYVPVETKWRGNPALEVGDIVPVENSDGEYITAWIMEQQISISGGMNMVSKCCEPSQKEINVSLSPTERKISLAMKNLEQAIANASALINGTKGGIFRVIDSDNDGVNDKTIWAQSADPNFRGKCIVGDFEGIGFSSDGGETHTQAITHDGINASAITVGKLNAERIAVYGNEPLTDFFKVEEFTEENGVSKICVVISAGDSEIISRQVNDKFGYYKRDGAELFLLSTSTFDMRNLERFRIGDCKITKRKNGNHTFDFSV